MNKEFDIAFKIADALKRVQDGSASEADFELLGTDVNKEIIRRNFNQIKEKENNIEITYSELKETLKQIKTHRPKRRLVVNWNVLKYASIITILIGSAYYFAFNANQPADVLNSNELAAPYYQQASGERVILTQPEIYSAPISITKILPIAQNDRQELSKPSSNYGSIVTPGRTDYNFTLSDGTKVYMNELSTVTFPHYFNDSIRSVKVEGEVYFVVAHNADKPFIVETNDNKVRVLGTEFNINTRDTYTTTLVKGSIELSAKNNIHSPIILKPGQQYRGKDGSYEVEYVETSHVTAWKDGYFFFKEERVETIMSTISYWYDYKFVFIDEATKDIRITGKFKRYDTPKELLEVIHDIDDFRIHINHDDKIVYIQNRNNK